MSTSPLEHKTSPIPLEEFEAGFLKPAFYSEDDIAKVMVEHLSRWPGDLTDRQKKGLARFKYDGSWNLADTPNIRDLEKFFVIFNDVYFNGVLTGYGKIELLSSYSLSKRFKHSSPEAFCQPIRPGNEIDPRFRIEKPSFTIVLGKGYFTQPGAIEKIRTYLFILLHEMVHAIFFIFKCGCNYGCRQKTLGGYRDVQWPRYHNIPWQTVAYAIEKADRVQWHLLGLNLELRREVSLTNDVFKGGLNLPNDAVLRSLGLDICSLRKILLHYRQQAANDAESNDWQPRLDSPLKANRCIRNDWIFTEEGGRTLRGALFHSSGTMPTEIYPRTARRLS
jgi:hypothetical protein